MIVYVSIHIHRKRKVRFGGEAEAFIDRIHRCHCPCDNGKYHYPDVLLTTPEECKDFVLKHSDHGGADRVLEVAGADGTFRLAWECSRPNAIVTIVALYDQPQTLPLPDMYGKNLTCKRLYYLLY